VLREVLVWPEANARLGDRPKPMEYRDGAMVEEDERPVDRAASGRRAAGDGVRPVG